MAGPEFFQTGYGRTYYEHQLPQLIKTLARIAAALEAIERKLPVPTTPAAGQE